MQICIVHLVRHSLNFCGSKDRKAVAKVLRRIYQATDDSEAEKALADFEAEWGQKLGDAIEGFDGQPLYDHADP